MTIGVIARVTLIPGKGPEFEAVFAAQAERVRANEPGNKLYQLVRSRDDENAYVVMELYDSDAALEAHRNAEHIVANRSAIAPLIGEKTTVEIFDAVDCDAFCSHRRRLDEAEVPANAWELVSQNREQAGEGGYSPSPLDSIDWADPCSLVRLRRSSRPPRPCPVSASVPGGRF